MPSLDEKDAIQTILRNLPSPCIVELGACGGEESNWLRSACRDPQHLHHILVEPDPRNCQMILNAEPTSRTRRLIIGAIADSIGMRPFWFAFNTKDRSHASGSLRKPTGHVALIPEVQFQFTGMVPCYTLDALFDAEWLTKIDLLYTDLQGSEREMIRGGEVALSHTLFCFMEVERVELYDGEALRDELVQMMTERNFVIHQEFDFNILFRNTAFVERGPR